MEDPEQRSRTMRAVKSHNTQPELKVRRLLHREGYRFRLHGGALPGHPDIVFSRRQKVIFVHGCFWHGHSCSRGARQPVNNAQYWKNKILRNKVRDASCIRQLRALKWKALIIWECQLKTDELLAHRMRDFLGQNETMPNNKMKKRIDKRT
jgi:DNA mismatch endonuclease (patch repair protein)